MTDTATNQSTTVDVAVVSGPTSPGTVADWELFFARRALATLKSKLGREQLLELLKSDIDSSAEQLAAWAAASNGAWQPALTELRVTGMSAAEFLAYFQSASADQPRLLAAQPEHFVLVPVEGGHQVVENLGPHIADFRVIFTDEDHAVVDLDPNYPLRVAAVVRLPDGTLVGHALHQFRDTADGFEVLLGIYFPGAASEELVEGHRQHLAVEFTNWIADAAASLGRNNSSPVPIVLTGAERYPA
jgi:uncharacterized protein